jgi:hypothetical protein
MSDFMDREDGYESDSRGAIYLSDSDSDWESDDEDEVVVRKQESKDKRRKHGHAFLSDHDLFKTHSVLCDESKSMRVVPNFIGGAVPRADKGDREYYCATMMTLFKPWRSPTDLKDAESSWDQVFTEHTFNARELEIIAHFNLRYECNDARDDHYAAMRSKIAEAKNQYGFTSHFSHSFLGEKDEFANDPDAVYTGIDAADNIDDKDREIGKKTQHLIDQRSEIREVLRTSKWLNQTTDGLLDIDKSRLLAPYKNRNTWSKILKEERKLFTANKLSNMPDAPPSCDDNTGKYSANRVEVLDSDYFLPKSKIDKQTNEDIISSICEKLTLNAEQQRAFKIVAEHASSGQPSPLKMYIGGMGGSGKSQVFEAIKLFFIARKEEYRFIILGPTGGSAALLNGSTYHSVFKILREAKTKSKNQEDTDGIRNDANAIAAINERLQGVEYILLDEISMVSCEDFQLLASQAAKARNIHDIEFGGLNVLVGGDFAQLPPTSGSSLYGPVAVRASDAMSTRKQNAVLGKILWHQFNTVVLLRQNMRQNEQTVEDGKLRTSLENMRYGACTPDDVEFLRTLIAGNRPGQPRLDSKKFRNVPVITARNVHKDTMNELGAEQFARDTGQELVEFYSVDKLCSKGVDRTKWRGCEQAHFKSMGKQLQHELWKATPSATSEHVPGILRLCIGMPVMIRVNEATELCMTKGQEGEVVGWDESTGPAGQRILDTLFIRLKNLKDGRTVQVPGLPVNVVPLCRTSTLVTCLLPDDTLLSIYREQVLTLTCFAMTDYASQGKTRIINVVHLNYCRDHRAVYVALSRGSKAAGTVIIQGFDFSKITSGMTGYLRQEFRELELLDEITRLRFTNQLPAHVTGIYRGRLLQSYRAWKKTTADPPHFHNSIKYNPVKDKVQDNIVYDQWRPSVSEKDKDVTATSKKRRVDTLPGNPNAKRARLPTTPANSLAAPNNAPVPILNPPGLIWDSRNYSCAYDSLFVPLSFILQDDPVAWRVKFSNMHPLLGLWILSLQQTPNSPETARDNVRQILNFRNPEQFPVGPQGLRLDDLYMAVTNRLSYANSVRTCPSCHFQIPGEISVLNQMIHVNARALQNLYPNGVPLSEWFRYSFSQPSNNCPPCSQNGINIRTRRITTVSEVPPVLFVSLDSDKLILDEKLSFLTAMGEKQLRLRGLVYFCQTTPEMGHFTSVSVDRTGKTWYHDGISTRRTYIEGSLLSAIPPLTLHRRGAESLCTAIYAEEI